MEFYEKNIGTANEGEPIIRAIVWPGPSPETEKCQSCQGVNGQHSDTCLAVVDQYFIYSCGVCGKDTQIQKVQTNASRDDWENWDERQMEETAGLRAFHESRGLTTRGASYQSVELHYTGCARIGMSTYW